MTAAMMRNVFRRIGTVGAGCVLVLMSCVLPVFAWSKDDPVGYVPQNLFGGAEALSNETTLGMAAADALCYVSGAEIAIVNGGDLSSGLNDGEQTYGAVRAAFAEDREVAVAQVTPKELCAMLEAGVSHIVVDPDTSLIKREQSSFEGFPQVSGFWFQYDAAGPAGERIMYVRLEGEGELDLTDDTRRITIAATADLFSGAYDFPQTENASPLGMTLSEALAEYIASGEGSDMGTGDHMTVAGSRDESLLSLLPEWLLPVVVLVLIIGAGSGRRLKKLKNEQSYEDSHDN